jgi:pimeloyl-ACP methyl ester carboxylesterase
MTSTEGIQDGFLIKNDGEESTPSSSPLRIQETSAKRTRNVRFVSPLLLYGYRPTVDEYENQTLCNKPLFIYLPGFDGTYLSPFLQFPELHTLFDIRCMTVGMDDRSTFDELQADVIQYIQRECQPIAVTSNNTQKIPFNLISSETSTAVTGCTKSISSRTRPQRNIYIVGESFGAILALLVSIQIQQHEARNDFVLRGLTIINSATCYDRSRLSVEGPKVSEMHDWLYPLGIVSRLLPLFTDRYSIAQLLLILQGKALPSVIDDPYKEAYMGRVAFSLPKVISFMPKETLQWRLSNWLKEGCIRFGAETPLNKKILLNLNNVRTLVIAGEFDVALPSIAEAERLANTIPNSAVHVVDGAGHASSCGSRIDLAALFRCYFHQELVLPEPIWHKQGRNAFTVGLQQMLPWFTDSSLSGSISKYRTAMVECAANSSGVYFGMLPRYDNATVGLSPLLYWDKMYYKKVRSLTVLKCLKE